MPAPSGPHGPGLRTLPAGPDADVAHLAELLPSSDADRLFDALSRTVAWRQEHIKLHGRLVAFPRLTAWYGDAEAVYRYSGLVSHPLPWTPPVLEIKEAVERVSGTSFNSVLLNLYRDGRDSVSWHQDNEPELGPEPVIASVSLGSARVFQMKHLLDAAQKYAVLLTHGSLLVMRGATQRRWAHQVPKTTRLVGPRINLTFRRVIKGGV
jgi:alkylated DNA repair dioxygenase AlkB